MRRKTGRLVPLELAICEAASARARRGLEEFHGYAIAKIIKKAADARLLTSYGTLYRALARLEKMGLLESRWEDPVIAAQKNRPGRRSYRLTEASEAALVRTRRGETALDLVQRRGDNLAPA